MATSFTKVLLSQSTSGKQIPVFTTTSPGTTLHIVSTDTSTTDEIYLYCSNPNSGYITASVLWGGTGSNDTISTIIPPNNGRTLLIDGRLLGSGLSVNAYSNGGTASFDGFANRMATVSNSDAIVSMWVNRVIANGGATPSVSTQAAMTTFMQTLNANGLTSLMLAVNCFVPDNLIASLTPIITAAGNNLWTNTNFVLSDLTVDGLKGDGSSKYLDTGVLGTNFPNDSNAGITFYAYSTSSVDYYDCGYTSNDSSTAFFLSTHVAGPILKASIWSATNDIVSGSSTVISPSTGSYLSVNRVSDSNIKLYMANSVIPHSVAPLTASVTRTASRVNTTIYVFAIRAYNSGLLPFGYTNTRMSFFAIHYGLTQAQSSILFNAIQTLRQSLGGGYI